MNTTKTREGRYLLKFSFLIVAIFYLSISLFLPFLHNHPHDNGEFHDNCPACHLERPSQFCNDDPDQTQDFIILTNKSFIRFSLINTYLFTPQFYHQSLSTRAPPLAA